MAAEMAIDDIHQKYIYIFSSATRPLYKQDVLDSLCVPAGYVIHYRYEKKRVDETIWKQAERGRKHLAGLRSFRDFGGWYALWIKRQRKIQSVEKTGL